MYKYSKKSTIFAAVKNGKSILEKIWYLTKKSDW